MFNWIDRVYKNARKRVFKNLDTGEILNLELQDDPGNIVKESPTPLTAHCLNMAQQELVDDMSKIYMGMNITADTVAGYGRINKTYGVSKQTTRSGRNKLPNNATNLTSNGLTFTINKDKSVTINGTATAQTDLILFGKYNSTTNKIPLNGQVTYGLNNANNNVALILVKDGTTQLGWTNFSKTITVDNIFVNYAIIRVTQGATISNQTFYPMIVQGESLGDYEQYGVSPSPEYPAPIKCVGDMVDLFDESNYKYVANAMINSAGLISAVAENYRVIYVEVKPNTEYVISFNIEKSIVLNTTSTLPAIGVVGTPRQVVTAREYTVTTDENAKYLCLRSDCRSNSSVQNYLGVGLRIQTKWKQGDKGSVETVSKNGSNTSSSIAYVDKPLCSIGNVRDELDYTNKKITRRCGQLVLNGTEEWQKHGSTANNVFYSAILSDIKHVSNNNAIANMLSTHFEVKAVNNIAFNNTVGAGIDTQNTLLIATSLNGISTVEAFKAWLASNPITVIYELATPVVEDIECLDKITQYNGQTTVYNRDGAEIEVSLTNNKAISEINQNLKQIEEAIANLSQGR